MSAVVYELTSVLDELVELKPGLVRWRLLDGFINWLRTRIQTDLGWMSLSAVRPVHVFFLGTGLSARDVPEERLLSQTEEILEEWYFIYVRPIATRFELCTVRVMVRGENVTLLFEEHSDRPYDRHIGDSSY